MQNKHEDAVEKFLFFSGDFLKRQIFVRLTTTVSTANVAQRQHKKQVQLGIYNII